MDSLEEWPPMVFEIRPFTVENAPELFVEQLRDEASRAARRRRKEKQAKKERRNGA